MNIFGLFKYAGTALRYFPMGIEAVKAVEKSPEIMTFIEAFPAIIREVAGTANGNALPLHETLVKAGVDTKQLAEAIHPPGPEGSGNPDAFNAGSDNASI